MYYRKNKTRQNWSKKKGYMNSLKKLAGSNPLHVAFLWNLKHRMAPFPAISLLLNARRN